MSALGSLGSLNVLLNCDTTTFTSSMEKAAYVADRNLAKISYRGKMTMAAISAAVIASGAAIALAIKKSIDRADEISKSSKAIGITAQQLSGLEYAAEMSGVGLDGLSTAFRKFDKSIYDSSMGLIETERAFKALGISITGNNGELKNNYDLFLETADALSRMADGAQKTALAQVLLGKSGASLLPLMNEGSAGIKKLTDEAEKLGLIMSDGFYKSSELFNDNLERIGRSIQGMVNQFSEGFLPSLVALSEHVTESSIALDNFKISGDVAGKSLIALVSTVNTAVTGYRMLHHAIKGEFGKILELDEKLAEDNRKMWEAIAGDSSTGSAAAGDSLKEQGKALESIIKKQEEGLKLTESLRTASELYNDEMQRYQDLLEAGAISQETFDRAAAKAKETMEKATVTTKALTNAADGIGDAFGTAFTDAIIEGKKFRDIMMSLLQDIERALLRSLVTEPLVSAISSGAKSFLGSFIGGGQTVGTKSAHGNVFSSGQLLPFASGGLITRPTIFPMANGGTGLAGEAGTEAIMPLFRGSGGDLGVKTSGARSVEVNVYAPPGSKVSQNQKSMGDRDQINILIDEAVAGSVKDSGSKTHRALKNSFGLRQSLTTR